MRRRNPRPGRHRPGKTLVMFALLLPVLLGATGLVIDSGMLLAAQRQAQNAADAAAMAAAMDKLRGNSDSAAFATAQKFVKDSQYNNLPAAVLEIHLNPTSGAYAGDANAIEAIVTSPVTTSFIQVLGANPSRQVRARAVAIIRAVASGDGAIVLNKDADPGLAVGGSGTLRVNGRVVVNSEVRNAATTANGSTFEAREVLVVGGVNDTGNFKPYTPGDDSPLHTGALPEPDPLKDLPTPKAGMLGVDSTDRGRILGSGTYDPGIYHEIKLGMNDTAYFNPGIFIIKPALKKGDGAGTISINGAAVVRVTGDSTASPKGVMFYITGSDFDVATGLPDIDDGDGPRGSNVQADFGSITINGSNTQLKGLVNDQSPFNGMLFYLRRWYPNSPIVDIQGGTSTNDNLLAGTIYGKWAHFKLAGSGKYDAQFIVGSLVIGGGANITLNYEGKNLGKANQVFLVE